MRLSKDFTLEEFTSSSIAKRFSISNIPGPEQISNMQRLCNDILQPIRDRLVSPIKVTSGFRSRELNKKAGGSKTSQHILGQAADIVCIDNRRLWHLIVSMIEKGEITVGQLINERNLSWIHISLPYPGKKNQIFSL